jgi:hypothetical protein
LSPEELLPIFRGSWTELATSIRNALGKDFAPEVFNSLPAFLKQGMDPRISLFLALPLLPVFGPSMLQAAGVPGSVFGAFGQGGPGPILQIAQEMLPGIIPLAGGQGDPGRQLVRLLESFLAKAIQGLGPTLAGPSAAIGFAGLSGALAGAGAGVLGGRLGGPALGNLLGGRPAGPSQLLQGLRQPLSRILQSVAPVIASSPLLDFFDLLDDVQDDINLDALSGFFAGLAGGLLLGGVPVLRGVGNQAQGQALPGGVFGFLQAPVQALGLFPAQAPQAPPQAPQAPPRPRPRRVNPQKPNWLQKIGRALKGFGKWVLRILVGIVTGISGFFLAVVAAVIAVVYLLLKVACFALCNSNFDKCFERAIKKAKNCAEDDPVRHPHVKKLCEQRLQGMFLGRCGAANLLCNAQAGVPDSLACTLEAPKFQCTDCCTLLFGAQKAPAAPAPRAAPAVAAQGAAPSCSPCERDGLQDSYPTGQPPPNDGQPGSSFWVPLFSIFPYKYQKDMGKERMYVRTKEIIAIIQLRPGVGRDPDEYVEGLFRAQLEHINGVRGARFGVAPQRKKRDDSVGHIIGKQFGGAANEQMGLPYGNVFPQSEVSNRQFEHDVENVIALALPLSREQKACIQILFTFNDQMYPHRPDSFQVWWWLDGMEHGPFTIQNPYP